MLGISAYCFGNVWAAMPGFTRGMQARRSKSGRWFSAASLAMAFVSLAVAPGVFGTLGILMGMAAVAKGDRYLGILGVVASAVFAVTGYYIAGALVNP